MKPAAIYHHFPSRAALVQAAVELTWAEVTEEGYALIPDPLEADPAEVLIAAAIAARRVWFRHFRLAPYMAATPESSEFLATTVALLANVFERLGFEGADAMARFHTYASFTLGSVTFGAARLLANEGLEGASGNGRRARKRFQSEHDAEAASRSTERTRASLDAVIDLSVADPARDEKLFEAGLRRLIASFD